MYHRPRQLILTHENSSARLYQRPFRTMLRQGRFENEHIPASTLIETRVTRLQKRVYSDSRSQLLIGYEHIRPNRVEAVPAQLRSPHTRILLRLKLLKQPANHL
jgi:hypothetical protein